MLTGFPIEMTTAPIAPTRIRPTPAVTGKETRAPRFSFLLLHRTPAPRPCV